MFKQIRRIVIDGICNCYGGVNAIFTINSAKTTLLHLALESDNDEIVSYLLNEKNADPTFKGVKIKLPPLTCKQGSKCAALIRAKNSKVKINEIK